MKFISFSIIFTISVLMAWTTSNSVNSIFHMQKDSDYAHSQEELQSFETKSFEEQIDIILGS